MQVQLVFGDETPQFLRQPDPGLQSRSQRRYSRPNSPAPLGSDSLAGTFAWEVRVVSAVATTTFETFAIGSGSLQDTLLRAAGAQGHRSKAVAGNNRPTVRGSIGGESLVIYSPRLIMYFNKSATRWL